MKILIFILTLKKLAFIPELFLVSFFIKFTMLFSSQKILSKHLNIKFVLYLASNCIISAFFEGFIFIVSLKTWKNLFYFHLNLLFWLNLFFSFVASLRGLFTPKSTLIMNWLHLWWNLNNLFRCHRLISKSFLKILFWLKFVIIRIILR